MPLGANKAAIFGVAGVSVGDVVLLDTGTADSDAGIAFTSIFNTTYGEFIFRFYNINPETDDANFQFQVNVASGSGYNETMTTTSFMAEHLEGGAGSSGVAYQTGTYGHQNQETGYQTIQISQGSDTDEACQGELHFFNPAGTTYVKHFYAHVQGYGVSNRSRDQYVAGYINSTTALSDINFKMHSGDFEGKIKVWGVK